MTRLGFTLQSTLRCLTIKIQLEVILLFFIFISLSYSSHIILLIFIIVNMLHFQNVIFSLFLEKATSLYFSYSLNLSVLKKTFLLYQIIYCGPSLKIGPLTSISVCTSLISFSLYKLICSQSFRFYTKTVVIYLQYQVNIFNVHIIFDNL